MNGSKSGSSKDPHNQVLVVYEILSRAFFSGDFRSSGPERNGRCLGMTTCCSDGDTTSLSRAHSLSGGHNTRTQYYISREEPSISEPALPSFCSLRKGKLQRYEAGDASRSPVNKNNISNNRGGSMPEVQPPKARYSPKTPVTQTLMPKIAHCSWNISIQLSHMLSPFSLSAHHQQSSRSSQFSTQFTLQFSNAFELQPTTQNAFHHQAHPDCQLLHGSQRLLLLRHPVKSSRQGVSLRCRRGVPTRTVNGGTTTFDFQSSGFRTYTRLALSGTLPTSGCSRVSPSATVPTGIYLGNQHTLPR